MGFAILLFFITASLGIYGIVVTAVIAVLYFLVVILIFSVANTIFNTALFVYADTGNLPQGYSQEIMDNAFRRKRAMAKGIVP